MATPTPPPALTPLYSTDRPDRRIPLARGSMTVEDGAGTARGRGAIAMRLAGGSRIEFRMGSPGSPRSFSNDATIEIPSLGAKGEAFVSTGFSSKKGTTFEGVVHHGLSFGDPTSLDSALAHVFNFDSFTGDPLSYPSGWIRHGRVELAGAGWHVTLDAVDDIHDLVAAIKAKGGHALTHVAKVERRDGSLFTAPELDDCLTVLGYVLSFARGAWTFPGLVVASGLGDPRRWRVWNHPRLRPWVSVMGWFDRDDPVALATAFDRMWPVWLDSARRPVLQTGVALLMDASMEINVESRIVLAQAGLERLAWQRLVQEKRWPSSKFNDKSTTAAMKIRELLKVSGISPALPAKLASLVSTPGLGTPVDGPAFAVAVRNRTVHPPKSGPQFFSTEVVAGAWQLSLEYLQLSLLAFLGYTGSVLSPITFKPHLFP